MMDEATQFVPSIDWKREDAKVAVAAHTRFIGLFVQACVLILLDDCTWPSAADATTSTTVTTVTLPIEEPWPSQEALQMDGTCRHRSIPVGSALELLPAGGRLAFIGDSFTVFGNDADCGFGPLLAKLIARTFERYCGTGSGGILDPAFLAQDGKQTYKPGTENNSYLEQGLRKFLSENSVPDLVIAEDAGFATDIADFSGDVDSAINSTLDVQGFVRPTTPSDPVTAGGLLLVDTPPFEARGRSFSYVPGNCSRYANGCNWVAHNRVLADIVAPGFPSPPGNPTRRVYVGNVARYFCHAYSTDDPVFALTKDGVHPSSNGHFLYALALFKTLGGDREDVTPEELFAMKGNCNPAWGPEPTRDSLRAIHRLVFETSDKQGDACLVDPGCGSGFQHCMDFCSANPANTCAPYFPCSAMRPGKSAACDDGNFCTSRGTCANGECVGAQSLLNMTPCDDANVCTTNETCTSGLCGSGTALAATAYCDDGDECTANDHCDGAGACVSGSPEPSTTACDDGSDCTCDVATPSLTDPDGCPDSCASCDHCNGAGTCSPGVALSVSRTCDDDDPCTRMDHCNGSGVCLGIGGGTAPCHDGDGCTLHDECDGEGHCVGAVLECSDGVFCNGAEVCFNAECLAPGNQNGVICDDGIFCNGIDTCSNGQCSVHAGSPCPGSDGDGNCSESCNEITDQCNVADSDASPCNDGLFCNGADMCSGGSCTWHAGDPCPGADGDNNCAESCNEATDLCNVADSNGSLCDDGTFCNGVDSCSSGVCTSHTGDPCPGADGDSDCRESCDEALNACHANDSSGEPCACSPTDLCTSPCGTTCNGHGACGTPLFCPVCGGPSTSCRSLGRTALALQTEGTEPSESSIRLKTSKGTATSIAELGGISLNGVDNDALTVCVYAGDGEVLWSGALPENECSVSAATSCWDRSATRLKYRNHSGATPNLAGITDISIRSVESVDRTALRLTARGTETGLPDVLTLEPDTEVSAAITVQLLTTAGTTCWQRTVVGKARHHSATDVAPSYSDFSGHAE